MELTQRIKQRLREVEDWTTVIDEIEAEADAAADAVVQSQAYFDLARACEDLFLDKARAMQNYQKAFKLDQGNLTALQRAREIYQEMAHLEMVTRLMGLEIKGNQDPDRAPELNYAYGRAMLNLRDVDTAKQFLEAASSAVPDNEEYQQRFQETLYDRGNWEFALENIYDQLRALTGEADPLGANTVGRGNQLSSLYMKAARVLLVEAPDDPRVLPIVFKALDAEPMNQEAGYLAETLLAASGHLQHVQKLMDRRVSLVEDATEKLGLLRHCASVWGVRLNNSEMAAYFWRQALELAYAEDLLGTAGDWHVGAYRTLKQHAVESGEADGLVPLAERGLGIIADSVNGALVALQAGEIAWRQFNDPDTARSFFEKAVAHAPDHPVLKAFQDEVGKLVPAAEKPAAEASEREPEPEPEPEPAPEPEAAVEPEPEPEPVESGGEEFGADEMKLIEKAQAAEEKGGKRAIDAWRDAVHKMPGKRFPRARLKQLYTDSNKWSNVADLVKDELKHVAPEDTGRQKELYWELADLYRERLRQPGLVVTTLASLEKLLNAEGDNETLLKVVEAQQAQFETMKRWPDLIGRIRRRAELTDEPDKKTRLYLEAGNLFLEKFNNQAEAIKSFEAVLEVSDANAEAIGKLKELYARRRDWEKMIAVQQKELALIEDPEERRIQLLEVARTAGTKIKKPALAIRLWSQVIEVDPENAEALEHLEHMQEREKDWASLSQTLERLIEVMADDPKRNQYLVKLGLLYADKLKDNAAAIRTWETLHGIDPSNRRASDALKKLYLAEGNMHNLEQFYARQEKWAEFIRVLERESDSSEGDARTALFLKIADLYKEKLGKPDRATRALEKALGDDRKNLTVAEKLIELYEEAGDERHIAGPLGIKLEHTDDPVDRQELLRRLAGLAETVAHDEGLAFSYHNRALAEDHENDEARQHLERLAAGTGMWQELVSALEKAIEAYGPESASLPHRLKSAEVYEQQLSDADAALRTNQAILEIEPEEATALASLERLYLALGRAEDLLNVLNTKLSLAETDDDRRAIQTRVGSIHEQLGHHEPAIEAYEAVLATGVEDLAVLAALDRMYLSLEKWADLADTIRRELGAASEEGPETRANYLLRLATLQQEQLGDRREAVELFRQVLDLRPEDGDARGRLEAWLEDEDLRTDVSQILLPVYEAAEAWPQLVQCLEIQAAAADSLDQRVELLLRSGAILSQAMGDSSRAFDVYAQAFRADPQNEVSQQALENIAAIEDRWTDFAVLFEEAVGKDLPGDLLNVLLGRLAILYDGQLGDTGKAVACYERAAEIDPGNVGALDALEKLYQREERWAELLEVYRRKVDLEEDPETRQGFRFQIAYLQEEMLGRAENAIATYNEILADEDDNMRATTALDRLYLVSENWTELAENLARQLQLTGDVDAQINLSLRLGQVYSQRIDQPGLAVETYSGVLDIDPHNESALGALEALLSHEDQELAVARILEPVYRTANNWPKLIETHEIMVKHSLDPSEKIGLLHQIGELYEISGDAPERAFAAFGRALKEDASNVDTQARIENLARQMGSFAELVALYEEVAEDVVDDQLRISLLTKVAQVDENALADADKAAATYEKILEVDPNNFEAVDALIEVHRRMNNFDDLVKAVVRKSEMVESPDDRKQLLLYAASVRETVMESPDGAIDLYQQVLAIDDADRTALDALEKLYIQLERWESLKDVYQRKTELAEDPEERRQVLYVLGQVYDAELQDTERAIDTYQAILDIDPGDYQAITALDRLFGQAERWLDQLQILERAVEVAQAPEEQTSIRYRVGALWESQLSDTIRAIEAYREVLGHDFNHQATIEALDRIVHGDNEPMAAAQVLAPLYEQLAEWDKVVDIYEVMVRHQEDPLAQIERLHQIAGIYERQLNEFDKAFDAYSRALSTDPQVGETIPQLDRLAEVTGDWEKYTNLLADQTDKILDPIVKVEMLIRLARIYEERIGDVDRAIARYLEVLQEDPENADTIEALDRVFTALERWPDLVENLRRRVAITGDELLVIDLYFRMGQIYQQNMGDLPKAIDAYREILNIDPGHSMTLSSLELMFAEGEHQNEIAEILEPIYYSAERWDALVKLGEAKLGATDDTVERLGIIQNVAEISERRLGEVGDAYIWWLRAYIDDPLNDDVCNEMERLAEVTQEWSHIVDVGDQILEGEVAPEVQQAVLSRSARVLDEQLMDAGRAIETYRRVLELDGENGAALAALDRIYTQGGLAHELAEILQRRIQMTMDTEQLIDLQSRLAATFQDDLGSPDQAIAAYRQVLDNDPSNQGALEHLETLYLAQYRWEDLFDTYQKMVDVANTDDDMAGCYQRMAKIAADALERESEAVDLWNRVLDLRGEDGLALGELAGLHYRAERWEELVEILERQVYVLEDPEIQVQAYQTLGGVYGEKLDKERNAMDAWLNALEIDDRNITTLEALHAIYERSQAWVELIDILERLIAGGADTLGYERLRDLYAKVGRIQGEYLMQSDMAIEAWHQVLEINAGDMEALAALEELYTQEARWTEAITVLERKSAALQDPEGKVDVLMQIASIWEEKLEDNLQASGAYMEILETDPGHLSASEALETIYRDVEDWGSLAELLITRAEVIDDRDMKVAALQAAAKVFEEDLEDQDSAFAVLQHAFNEDYVNETTARELERLATQANKWADLLNEYNGLVQTLEDPMERCELWVKIGRWYGEHLNRPDYGIQSLEQALELNPESVSALRELAAFHRRGGDASKLAETLARIVPLEQDPEAQAEVLLDLAEVQETSLADVDASVESYRRVLELNNESTTALDALGRLHEQQSMWQDLVSVLSRRATVTDDPDHVLELKKRIGYVQETSLADPAAAIETYRDILASEPTDRDSLTALERLYATGNQVDEYLEILEAQLDATVEVDEQITYYDKMAHALVELANDPDRATEVLEKVVMLDPQRDSAYRKLEELYTNLEKWAELVETYRSHVDAIEDPFAKVELLAAMGEVYEKSIEDVDRAVETYSEILGLDPENFDAANTLSRLQEAIEDWPQAVETMGQLVELTNDPAARLELLTRLGNVFHHKLMDEDQAEMRLNQALELDPGHVPALKVLADIYKSRADWLKAARILETASEHSNNSLEKTQLASEAGFIHSEELEDREKALEQFSRTLELDPEHIRVGLVLAEMHYETGNYSAADPIFDMLTRKADQLELDDDQLRELYLRAARAARQLGDTDKSLKQYKRAYDIDSTDHEVLSGMADLLFYKEDWERAFKLYQTILVQHRDTQSDDDTVRVYYRLGTVKERQGEPRKALNYFEKALEVQPHHPETLAAVIELQGGSGDWEGVIQAKRAMIDVTQDGDRQFELYKDIGGLYAEKIGNKDKAAAAYESALEIKVGDYPLLHQLLDLYTSAKRWEEAINVIDRIVAIEDDVMRRSRYNYTAGVLLRDEMKSHDEAIDRFNMVLDDDPTMLKAFQAIDTMVTLTRDWKTLERSYRKMLKRLPTDSHQGLKITLWGNLAEIYRSRMSDFKSAAAAFEVAAKLDPGNIERHIKLAELYETLMREDPQAHVQQAVQQHQVLIAHEPFRYPSYNALYNIYTSAGHVDKAYCVAMVLSFLKKASPEQAEFFQRHHRTDFVQARQRLSEDTLRKHVFHPDEDLYLTGILGLVAPALAAWRAADLPPTIKPKERVDIQTDPTLFSRLAKYVKDVLNLPPPDVFLRPGDSGDLSLLNIKRDNSIHPTMVVFQNLLKGKTEKHLAFALGRYMMDLYMPHYAYVALDRSPQNLKQVFMACLMAAGLPVQGDSAALQQIAREITGRMQAGAVDQLKTLIKRFIEAGGSTDVKRWASAAELTNYRVGLLLCGDITIAAQMVSQEQGMLGSAMSPKDKIKELVLYSISEDFFQARRAVGMAVA